VKRDAKEDKVEKGRVEVKRGKAEREHDTDGLKGVNFMLMYV
jgi:hypothetical protein